MKKLRKILKLSDPFPNLGYEISCYLKAILALILIILGVFFLLSPFLRNNPVFLGFGIILKPFGEALLVWEEKVFGQNFTLCSLVTGILLVVLGIWVFWQIKLVKKFFETLKS